MKKLNKTTVKVMIGIGMIYKLNDYIGWSAYGRKKYFLLNGLLCGLHGIWFGNEVHNNIFRKNNFMYHSNNDNYKDRLPGYKKGDTTILQYDSDLAAVSFSKDNDNGNLDLYIKHLPNDLTC